MIYYHLAYILPGRFSVETGQEDSPGQKPRKEKTGTPAILLAEELRGFVQEEKTFHANGHGK